MSCAYYVYCLDCKSTHETPEDSNHARDEMLEIAAAGKSIWIAAVAIENVKETLRLELKASYYARYTLDSAWFVKHGRHKLTVISEYGDIEAMCNKRTACAHCEQKHICKLPINHEGDCV